MNTFVAQRISLKIVNAILLNAIVTKLSLFLIKFKLENWNGQKQLEKNLLEFLPTVLSAKRVNVMNCNANCEM